MKAIRVEQFGGPETLRLADLPTPEPGPGEILVRVHAAGINPVDTYIRSGAYARLPTLPFTPGLDAAGRVAALGSGITHVALDDRVYIAGSQTGTYAEYCLCTAAQVQPLPAAISFPQGAALGVPYATAYRALFQRADAKPGETVLIHGGTGGVGLAALQLARAAGLKVFATGGSEAGRQTLQAQGADAVFDHSAPGYAEAILAQTNGQGVDLILEMLANKNLGLDLTLLAPRGRVAIIGSRGPVEINPRDAMVREADIRGVTLFAATPDELAAAHRAIGEGLTSGALNPIVGQQFPLGQAPAAHQSILTPGASGKIVLLL
jgi:NADPH2:quinone reductase